MMKKSITIVVVCVTFFVQVNQSSASVPNIKEVLQDPEYAPLSETAKNLVATILDHVQYMLRNRRASDALITIAKNIEQVLVSQNGQDNVMAILDVIAFFLKDPNASKIVTIWCDKADILVTTDEGRGILKTAIIGFHRVLTSQNVIGATTALMDGIEYALKTLSANDIKKGMSMVQHLLAELNTNSKTSPASNKTNVSEANLQSREIPDFAFDSVYSHTFQPFSTASVNNL